MTPSLPPELVSLTAEPQANAAKYEALTQAMRAAVASGHWAPGERLPTEAALASALPFSLGTVQRALGTLAADGLVVRRKRSGTFVAETQRELQDPLHLRFLDDRGGVLPVYPRIVARECVRENGHWLRHLGPCPKGVLRIDRVIDINGEFSVYSKFFADAARFAPLLTRPLKQLETANFKQLLALEFGIPALRFAQTLQLTTLPRALASALDVAPHTATMLLEVDAATSQHEPVYFQQLYIPPHSRKLVVGDGRNVPALTASRKAHA